MATSKSPQVEHKSAKTPLSEQGDVERGGKRTSVRDRRLNVRLPLRGVCSVGPLRGLVKPRNQRRSVDRSAVRQNGGTNPTSP